MTQPANPHPEPDPTDVVPTDVRPGQPDLTRNRGNVIRVLTLRREGYTYEQIAPMVGYSNGPSCRRALRSALDRWEAENVAELRLVENTRLDRDEQALTRIIKATTSTPEQVMRAVDARTRLSARRARMNGLDAPVAVAITAGLQAEALDVLAQIEELVVKGEVVATETVDDPPTIDG